MNLDYRYKVKKQTIDTDDDRYIVLSRIMLFPVSNVSSPRSEQ